jgi:hypothetical protein
MPNKRKQSDSPASVRELTVPAALLHQLVKGPMTQDEVETVCRSVKSHGNSINAADPVRWRARTARNSQ